MLQGDFEQRFKQTHLAGYNAFITDNGVDGVNITAEDAIRMNIVKLNVYYERLEYTHYETQISYPDFQFISDLGMYTKYVGYPYMT